MFPPPFESRRGAAWIGDDPDPAFGQAGEARVVCRAVDENGMRREHADEFLQPVFKARPVREPSRAPAHGADGDHAVFRDARPAVSPRFGRAPADVVDDGEPVFPQPVAQSAHPVRIVLLDGLGEILIGGEIRRDRTGEMPKHSQHEFTVVPYTARPIELIIIDVPTDECIAEKGIILSSQRISVSILKKGTSSYPSDSAICIGSTG